MKYFTVVTWEKTGLNGCVHDFSVDYNTIDIIDIRDIYIKLMKNLAWYKRIFGFIWRNRSCKARLALVDINSNETLFLSIYCQC